MSDILLNPDIQHFIFSQENADEQALILQHRQLFGVPTSLIAEQLASRRKAKHKLPTWYKKSGILYPPGVSIEQSSSEATAQFKVSLIRRFLSGGIRAADLTAGFGVDSFFLSTLFENFHYVETSEALTSVARKNHLLLGRHAISYHTQSAEDFLNSHSGFDLLYIDPSRRVKDKKVIRLEDYSPNVVDLQEKLFTSSRYVLIKSSPLLDIQRALKQLRFVKLVVIVAVQNECKELLFLCEKDFVAEPAIEALGLDQNGNTTESFSFTLSEERKEKSSLGDVSDYLYEPNAAILKAGAFRLIGNRYQLQKLHVNTHLYSGDQLYPGFPGRVFQIISQANSKNISQHLNGFANVITRNYPLTTDQLKRKFKLKDGGENYLIGFTGKEKKYLLIASRIK